MPTVIKINLAAARVNANLTQEQAAEAVKVSRTTLINWEKGKTKIPFTSLVALCSIYDVPVDYIFLPYDLT